MLPIGRHDPDFAESLEGVGQDLNALRSAQVGPSLNGGPEATVRLEEPVPRTDRDQVVVTVNVDDFMMLATSLDVHPGVIALREAELNAHQQ